MLPQTGERQVAENIEQIKPNHRERYQFAINEIESKYGKDTNISILDAACGIGYGTMMLAEAFPNAFVLGVDIYPDAITAANRAYKIKNNDFSVLDLSDANAWGFAVNEFNAIVSIETIEHVKDDDGLISRYVVTAPFLIGSVPNQDIVPFDAITHPFHHRHYTKSEYDDLLSRHGYKITKWACQYDKIPGHVYEADDGMGFICSAERL